MNGPLEHFHQFQNIQVSSLLWGNENSCPGCLVHLDQNRLSCLSKTRMEAGSPVVLTVLVDKLPHEMLGRVKTCNPAENGEFLVCMDMEYTDLETRAILGRVTF